MKKSIAYLIWSSGLVLLSPVIGLSQVGKWEIIKTKNEAPGRNECGMVAINGKLFVVGGEGSGELDEFNLQTLQWTRKKPAPVSMNHFQAVSYQDRIYILEAFTEGNFPNQSPSPNVYVYDTRNDSWHKATGLQADRRRAAAGAAEYNGKLYLVAGIQHGHSSGTNGMFDQYDPKTDTWTALPDAPHIRDHCTAAVIGDKLYALGGRNTSYHEANNFMAFFSKTVLEVDCYDFKSGKWSTLEAKLPMGSGGGAAVNFNGKLFYMGGERATETSPNGPQKNVYFLDPSSQTSWSEAGSLNMGRNGMAAAVVKDKIYAAGGTGGGPPPGRPNANPSNEPGANPSSIPPGNRAPATNSGGNNMILEVFTSK